MVFIKSWFSLSFSYNHSSFSYFKLSMKYLQFLWILLAGLVSISPILFAQNTNTTVPTTVQNNCLLTQSGTIDFCPEYRAEIRDINIKLFQKRTDAEIKWAINLYDTLNKDSASFQSEQYNNQKESLTGSVLLFLEYEKYLTTLFTQFFNTYTNEANLVERFFKTTYFKDDQSGLGITNLSLYTQNPQQYDQSIVLQLGVRNFSPNQISNIEDIYCFSTINNQDYIYPLNLKPTFQSNTITNLIIELNAGTSPLFEKIGQKNIACTLVYTQFNETKYTNRGKVIFDIK